MVEKKIDKESRERLSYTFSPNMYIDNADIRQSTLNKIAFAGSIIANSSFAYSELLNVNMRNCALARVTLDNSIITHCSLRNVNITACDVEGLTINGVRIGDMFLKPNGGSKN